MYKNNDDALQCTMPEEQPELSYILDRMEYELTEIHGLKYELIRKGHQLKDTNVPEKGESGETMAPSKDLVSILNGYLSSLEQIKGSLSQFNKKLNSLI